MSAIERFHCISNINLSLSSPSQGNRLESGSPPSKQVENLCRYTDARNLARKFYAGFSVQMSNKSFTSATFSNMNLPNFTIALQHSSLDKPAPWLAIASTLKNDIVENLNDRVHISLNELNKLQTVQILC